MRSFQYIFSQQYWLASLWWSRWLFRLAVPGVCLIATTQLGLWQGGRLPSDVFAQEGWLYFVFGEPGLDGEFGNWIGHQYWAVVFWLLWSVLAWFGLPMFVLGLVIVISSRRKNLQATHQAEDDGNQILRWLRIVWGNAYVSECAIPAMQAELHHLAKSDGSMRAIRVTWMYIKLSIGLPVWWSLPVRDSRAISLMRDSWGMATIGEFGSAVELSEQAFELDPDELTINTNLATGLLFTGREREALAIILRDAPKGLGRSWHTGEERLFGDVYIKDIGELRRAGHDHPLFDVIIEEIEKQKKKDA
jgi:hypothetical protein